MRQLLRPLRLVWAQKKALAGVILCSQVAGLLWGASIGMAYPLIETIFRGESLHHWVEGQITTSEKTIRELEAQIAVCEAQRAQSEPGQLDALDRQLADCAAALHAERCALDGARRAEPLIRLGLPASPFPSLVVLMAYLLACAALRNLFLTGDVVLVERISQRVGMELRERCFRRALETELSALEKGHSAELMSQFTSSMNHVVGGIRCLLGVGLREPVRVLACLAGAAFISWRLLLVSLLLIPLALLVGFRLARVVRSANHRLVEGTQELYRRLAESFTLMVLIKAFTLERREQARFDHTVRGLYHQSLKVAGYHSLARGTVEVVGVAVACLTIVLGGYLVLHGQTHLFGIQLVDRPLGPGELMVFYAFLLGANEPARRLGEVVPSYQTAAAAAAVLYPLLDEPSPDVPPAQPTPVPHRFGRLSLERVSFAYRPDQPVLRDLDLCVRSGETVALIGPNGCGKTTLANLILRLYEPDAGAVRVDGTDVREFPAADLRGRIGLVTQQPLLFDDSIRDNIGCGATWATDAEIVRAARSAQAHEFIERLPEAYGYRVGERGCRLSGGQRQRLALARAMLRDPAVLILDEATSQIDAESERLIQTALKEGDGRRITLLITHRPSLLSLANRIVVLEGGAVADVGTHAELLGRSEFYRQFCQGELRTSA
jgi:ATP-binding cassette subfamily B protein/subfamily B ATP-binding cassette protein MsbA